MSAREKIRRWLRHGEGTRRVSICSRGEVLVMGCPDGGYDRGWHKIGMMGSVLSSMKKVTT